MITPRNIKHYLMDLEDKGLSPTTIKIYLTLLKVIINYAKKHNMVRYEIELENPQRCDPVRQAGLTLLKKKSYIPVLVLAGRGYFYFG